MPDAIAQLSEKQREALRLIGRGHDAKSCARELDRSVHAVNERLGDVVSRKLVGVESVPARPDGNEIVVFQTKYALGGDKIETIALVREGDGWRVVGAYVE